MALVLARGRGDDGGSEGHAHPSATSVPLALRLISPRIDARRLVGRSFPPTAATFHPPDIGRLDHQDRILDPLPIPDTGNLVGGESVLPIALSSIFSDLTQRSRDRAPRHLPVTLS
jgi:hypothetical protein